LGYECMDTDECEIGLVCGLEGSKGYCRVPIKGHCVRADQCIGYGEGYSMCSDIETCELLN